MPFNYTAHPYSKLSLLNIRFIDPGVSSSGRTLSFELNCAGSIPATPYELICPLHSCRSGDYIARPRSISYWYDICRTGRVVQPGAVDNGSANEPSIHGIRFMRNYGSFDFVSSPASVIYLKIKLY